MRTFIYLIAMLFGMSATATPKLTCEENAKLTPRAAFVKLVKTHIADQTLSKTVVAWLIAQPKPRMPTQQQSLSIHNLALRDGFRDVLRKMRPEDWPLVVEELKNLDAQLTVNEKSVGIAKAETKNIFSLLYEQPLKLQDQPANLFIPTKIFVASNGEVFGMAKIQPQGFIGHGAPGDVTYIFDYTRNQKYSVHVQPEDDDFSKFYETEDGRIIFADIARSQLTVVDARSGTKLIDKMGIAVGIDPYPLIYESGGQLKVAIPRVKTFLPMDSSHVSFLEIVDVASQTLNRQIFDDGLYHAQRLANHHAYVFGLRSVHENVVDGKNREAVIYDLTTGEYVMITRFKGYLKADKEVLIEDQGPKMLLFVNGQENRTSGYYRLDTAEGRWEKFLERIPNHIEKFFTDSSNHAWIARFRNFTGLHQQISFHKISDPETVVTWIIPTAEGGTVFDFTMATTPLGQIFTALESKRGPPQTLHVYNFTTGESHSLPISPQLKVQEIGPPFYMPAENRIHIPLIKKDGTWSSFQLWGPDEP